MRSVKLTIEGAYWDSQIYSGELMLFDFDGAFHRIDWHQVVDQIAIDNPSVQTALRVAFSDSDLFYNPKVRKVLCDPHIEAPIKSQLSQLADLSISSSQETWRRNWRTEDTPFGFLPNDTDVYYNQIFAGGDEGLFSIPRNAINPGRLFKKQPTKHHDARIFQVKASDRFTAIAAAAGDDGLFEFAFKRGEGGGLNQERQLAKRPCSACDWAFQSVMGWTIQSAFLANFNQERDTRTNKAVRSFDRIVEASEMFGNSFESPIKSFTWGSREKIYRISENGVEISNYSPSQLKTAKGKGSISSYSFSNAGTGSVRNGDFDMSSPIATGTAPFGTILEFDDRIVVFRSDGEIETYLGEVVQWRVFPRSEHYSNQLHIIYEDHMIVISFVHDYFVDQDSKLYGFSRGPGGTSSEEKEGR